MAVESVVGVLMEELLKQTLSFAAEEIRLFRGCKKSLESLAAEVAIIQGLVADAEIKKIESAAMKTWFPKLKAVMLDAEDVLEEYNYELLRLKIPQTKLEKVRNFFFPGRNLAFRSKMAHKIKDVNSELKGVSELGRRYGLTPSILNKSSQVKMDRVMTSPSVQEEDIVGRDDDVIKVVDMLVSANNDQNIALTVTAIVAMGGQGKTTVAQLVCKKDEVMSHFEKIVWVCVSDNFKIERLLNEIVQSITGQNPNLTNRQALIEKLQETLKGKRYLVVFDDVWNEDKQLWELMKKDLLEIGGSKGTKILVTTRNHNVVSIMHASQTHVLSNLSENDSLSLFKKRAFAEGGVEETPEFVAIGQRIIKRCCGVPLAIKVLGGLLYSKREIRGWFSIEKSDIWSLTTGQEGVRSCIELSYDHLPSLSLKQCFAYCAIFSKDTVMERESVIQQWMAHGFLIPPEGTNLQMEELGREYLNILLWNSLSQELSYNKESKTWSFKMHDLVHDFALHISKDYCFTKEDSRDVNGTVEAVHVSLIPREMYGERIDIPQGISSKIRTLNLGWSVKYSNGNVKKFRYLRTLKLSGDDVKKLPTSIGRLKLLRYLCIEGTSIRSLPSSYVKLYNLQTLRLPYLSKGKSLYCNTLVSLRHIYVKQRYGVIKSKCWIVGIKKLVHLQTLSHFKVGNEKGCKIEELEKLDNLRGSLIIYGIDKVKDGEEAQKANISRKVNIDHLELHWGSSKRKTVNDEDVLKGLTPHSFLKSLVINNFKGLRFPSWMTTTNNGNGLFNNLIEVKLIDCDSLEQLPPLGHLPRLQKIKIFLLNNVKHIGAEFYGCTNYLTSTSCAFPTLEELHIEEMSNLEEWLGAEHLSPSLQAFPHLRNLIVLKCDKLSNLPSLQGLTSLTDLSILLNRELAELPSLEGLSSLQKLSIERNKMLTKLASLEGLSSLQELSIESNEMLSELPSLEGLSSLQKLTIEWNEMLSELPSLEGLSSLQELTIKYNRGITAVPVGLERLPNLTSLYIGGFSEELDYFPWPHVTTGAENNELYFGSLKTVDLYGWSKLTSLPEQIQYLPSLTSLRIRNFKGVEALPEWLGNIHSLSSLYLWFNENLKYMPSVEAMQRLTNLHQLWIAGSPHLKKRCTRGSRPEWDKISHIPEIYKI